MTEYEKICDFQNLYQAHIRSRKGKRKKAEVIRFEMNLAENLTRLSEQLKNHTYQMKGYYHFTLYEPKKRDVYAAYYQDRVILHCICDEVIQPILGPRLIYDNAACQVGKGTHFAIHRFSYFLQEHFKKYGKQGYILKCDIRKYFQSIDQTILKEKLSKVIKDREVRQLLFHYIDSYQIEGQLGKGLPLGNQTSQWFALYYLDSLDRFIKETLRIKYYIRYMDDFLLVHSDKQCLVECLIKIRQFLSETLALELNAKTRIDAITRGVEFLGWKFFITDTGKIIRKVKYQSKIRFKRRIKKLKQEYDKEQIKKEEVKAIFASYRGHLSYGNTYHLRKKVYQDFW